ncbi:MAG: tetratricopeptide repeat protein [Cyanobacteria bacterium TGS_CYA1]|nr:tetratricopeptide repeat protein [Cyanobacteria bacterium TGS_CYA1]
MLFAKIFAKKASVSVLVLLAWLGLGQLACQEQCLAQSILPARPEAPGGGNPLEGLGRPDDPNPSRALAPDVDTTNDGAKKPPSDTTGSEIVRAKKRRVHSPQLVPPPSPVVMEGFSSADDKNPMKQAILHIGRKEYEKAQAALTALIADDPDNLKARYLEAVVFVHRRKYLEAEKAYKKVIELSNDEDLKKMAELGLKKLDDLSSDESQ